MKLTYTARDFALLTVLTELLCASTLNEARAQASHFAMDSYSLEYPSNWTYKVQPAPDGSQLHMFMGPQVSGTMPTMLSAFKPTIYIQVSPERLTVRNAKTGETISEIPEVAAQGAKPKIVGVGAEARSRQSLSVGLPNRVGYQTRMSGGVGGRGREASSYPVRLHMRKLAVVAIRCVLVPFTLALPTMPASGMDFRIYFQPELKQRVVIGEGIISEGDDSKFRIAAQSADRDAKGHITFVLNSLGGSVPAAFALVRAMDQLKVYAVVPDNALCASACASIVYISAERHLVVGSGRLGFHTCYVAKGIRNEPSAVCNEEIAKNAMSRGTSYASVDLFTYDYGPTKMAWLEKTLACQIGLCRP